MHPTLHCNLQAVWTAAAFCISLLHSFVPLPQRTCESRFPMKRHTIIRSTVAALALAFIPNTHAQITEPDSNATGKVAKPVPAPAATPQIANMEAMNVSLTYEAFSLPIAKAGELQRKGLADDELYKELVSSGKLERLLVVRTKAGQRAVLENVTEYKYPTEFTEPRIPGDFAGKPEVPTVPLPIAPTAYEKKDVGDTMEFEPALSQEAKAVDVQILVSHTALARREKWGQGLAEVEQPQFESQKLSTNLTASIGSPRFIGTLNPPFGNGAAARAEQNVWFCFITPTIAQNNIAAPKKITR